MSPAVPLAFVNSTFGWIVLAFLALLLFGSRLPGVARNLGKGINEFKKGLSDKGDDEEAADDGDSERAARKRVPASSEASKTRIDDTSV
jgi:sec-independent protein translocase protein TatA